jgi:hypothetical protein
MKQGTILSMIVAFLIGIGVAWVLFCQRPPKFAGKVIPAVCGTSATLTCNAIYVVQSGPHRGRCDVQFPIVSMRVSDHILWYSEDGSHYEIDFSQTPFPSVPPYDVTTATAQLGPSNGTLHSYYAYSINLIDLHGNKHECKSKTGDPTQDGDPGIKIRN